MVLQRWCDHSDLLLKLPSPGEGERFLSKTDQKIGPWGVTRRDCIWVVLSGQILRTNHDPMLSLQRRLPQETHKRVHSYDWPDS